MPEMKDVRVVIVTALSLFAMYAMAEEAVTFTPNELKWKPTAGYPGREQANIVGDLKKDGLYVTRVKLPPNYTLQAHSHPDDRTYTILSGTWYVGWGEKYDETKLIPLPAGSF